MTGLLIPSRSSRAEEFGKGLNFEENTEKTYRALSRKAERWLEQRVSVIVDRVRRSILPQWPPEARMAYRNRL